MEGKIFNLVNIYAPNLNSEQIKFIETLSCFIQKKKNLILAGDFNFVESNELDRNNLVKNKKQLIKKNQNEWARFFSTFELKEASLDREKFINCMTWSNGLQSSRIDRFYSNEKSLTSFNYFNNINFTMSDHRLIITKIEYTESSKNKLYSFKKDRSWKLNENVLNDQLVNNKIIQICNDINNFKKKHNEEWYEVFIKKIIKLLQRESRRLSSLRKEKLIFYMKN